MVLNYSRSLAEDFAGEQPRWGQWWPGSLRSQMGAILSPREHLALSEDVFGYPAGELPLAVSDERPGIPPNTLQYPGQPPPQRITRPVQSVSRSKTAQPSSEGWGWWDLLCCPL